MIGLYRVQDKRFFSSTNIQGVRRKGENNSTGDFRK